MQINYAEHFRNAEELSWHLIINHKQKIQREAELLTSAGKATMACDITKKTSQVAT